MTRSRLYFENWLSLPRPVAERFKLRPGDLLEVEATADGIFLRPVRGVTDEAETAAAPAVPEPAPMVQTEAEPPPKRPAKRAMPVRTAMASPNRAGSRRKGPPAPQA